MCKDHARMVQQEHIAFILWTKLMQCPDNEPDRQRVGHVAEHDFNARHEQDEPVRSKRDKIIRKNRKTGILKSADALPKLTIRHTHTREI